MNISINSKTCTMCGSCVAVCPAGVYYKDTDGTIAIDSNKTDICITCGHCMAVCKTESPSVEGLSYKTDFFDLVKGTISFPDFYNFLAARRSVRAFRGKPVPREVLQKIVDCIAFAPYGVAPHNIDITIIQTREAIEKALPLISEFLGNIEGWMRNPFMRFMMRKNAGLEQFNTVRNHLMPIIHKKHYNLSGGHDRITRGAPAMILFHAEPGAEKHTEDGHICLTYSLLAAHALGLGATAISLLPPALNKIKKIREILGVPEGHETVGCIILGYPKYSYLRGIRRKRNDVIWV